MNYRYTSKPYRFSLQQLRTYKKVCVANDWTMRKTRLLEYHPNFLVLTDNDNTQLCLRSIINPEFNLRLPRDDGPWRRDAAPGNVWRRVGGTTSNARGTRLHVCRHLMLYYSNSPHVYSAWFNIAIHTGAVFHSTFCWLRLERKTQRHTIL